MNKCVTGLFNYQSFFIFYLCREKEPRYRCKTHFADKRAWNFFLQVSWRISEDCFAHTMEFGMVLRYTCECTHALHHAERRDAARSERAVRAREREREKTDVLDI